MPGRRPPAEQLDEAVVAAAAAERLLLAVAAGQVELEGGPRVVVEAADEGRFQPVRHAERVEVRPDRGEVLRAGVAQVVGDPRRAALIAAIAGSLRVEQAQHVALQAVPLESTAARRGAPR